MAATLAWSCSTDIPNRDLSPRPLVISQCHVIWFWFAQRVKRSLLTNSTFYKIFSFFRFVITLAYYGLALNSDFLASKYGIHLYFFLQMLVDIPGCLAALFLMDKIGRKTVMIGAMLLGCVACIACVFTIMFGGKGNAYRKPIRYPNMHV